MLHRSLCLCLLALLLASCAAQATPIAEVSTPTMPDPTMIPSPSAPPFIVLGAPFYGDPNLPYFKIVQADPTAAQNDTFEYYGTTYHYNGIPTIQAKTRIAMQKAGGIMFWTLDHDAQGDLSLLNAIHEAVHEP